ncbi:hypothetical protein PC110_g9258 [Phytophthora cactorum]|uniref:Uncharacterized protein n=1 Tax=Phytophthora cactorum TaxID=29920 RepID=A0A329SCQ5_9STRA|nr:hypothetical protein PC110_g9258 [Phytophthora cactorum]
MWRPRLAAELLGLVTAGASFLMATSSLASSGGASFSRWSMVRAEVWLEHDNLVIDSQAVRKCKFVSELPVCPHLLDAIGSHGDRCYCQMVFLQEWIHLSEWIATEDG